MSMNTPEHNEIIQKALGRLEGMIVEVYVNAKFKAAAVNPLTVKIVHVGDADVRVFDYTWADKHDEYPIADIDRISIGRIK